MSDGTDGEEAESIRRVLGGDRDSYEPLMRRHYGTAFRMAYRITGDREDAEEVTQEAFLRAYNRLASFRQQSSFATWVNRITMNTALNLVERRKRDAMHGSADVHAVGMHLRDRAAGPERMLLDRESFLLREEAMAALTPMERTAFALRHLEELPVAEIAAALRVPVNSAKQAVFRAVTKLRRSLGPAVEETR